MKAAREVTESIAAPLSCWEVMQYTIASLEKPKTSGALGVEPVSGSRRHSATAANSSLICAFLSFSRSLMRANTTKRHSFFFHIHLIPVRPTTSHRHTGIPQPRAARIFVRPDYSNKLSKLAIWLARTLYTDGSDPRFLSHNSLIHVHS